MRRVGLGETLRIALMGNDERVSADTALRIGLVSEVVPARSALGARARDRGVDRRQAAVCHSGHREGDLGVAGQALSCGAGAESDLHEGSEIPSDKPNWPPAATGASDQAEGAVMPAHALTPADRVTCWRLQPDAVSDRYNGQWFDMADRSLGLAGVHQGTRRSGPRQVGILLRNRALTRGGVPGRASRRRNGRRHQPVPRRRPYSARDIEALDLPFIVGASDDLASPVLSVGLSDVGFDLRTWQAAPSWSRRAEAARRGRPEVAVRMLTSGTTGPPKRIDLTYDMLARSVIGPTAHFTGPDGTASGVSRSSTPRWCTSAASSVCCSVFVRHGLSRCWTASSSISGPKPCAGTAPARCRWCPRPCAWCCIRI